MKGYASAEEAKMTLEMLTVWFLLRLYIALIVLLMFLNSADIVLMSLQIPSRSLFCFRSREQIIAKTIKVSKSQTVERWSKYY